MDSVTVRDKFLKYFENKGHKIMPSSSLTPNDESVLFTTAGMQQFKSYYTAPENALKDFGNKNIVTVQKCIRTGDIDEVGDNTHLTFFEMLGNFSFGGYGRKEAILYAHEFITKEMGLTISYVTIYKGEGKVPKDEESKKIWENIDPSLILIEEGSDVFWGPTGDSGPCGPTTEVYCKNAKGDDVEIWNIVFNEYFCDGSRDQLNHQNAELTKLPVLGIDTGMGLERLMTVINNKESVYDIDLFNNEKSREERIIVDHVKASLFIVSDGIIPANTGAGYVLRRLIRRASRFSKGPLKKIIDEVKEKYRGIYNLKINNIIEDEEIKFKKNLELGLKEFEKGTDPFILFTTYGFPIELTEELANEKGIKIDKDDFNKKMIDHQKLSQTSASGMFKGGLLNHNDKTIRLHTAHHLLLAGLQSVVSSQIKQRGSNITEDRLRMDFMCENKLTDEEKLMVENWVNDKINQGLDVIHKDMPLEEAEKIGAQMEFGNKYPSIVSVYLIKDNGGNIISKEFCGGPHVSNTKELGTFKIQKEEAVARGIRRIKATLS